MTSQKTNKVSSVFAHIFGTLLVLEMVVAGLFVLVASVMVAPLIFLGNLIDKKVFRMEEVNLEDDPEWYRSGGRGSVF